MSMVTILGLKRIKTTLLKFGQANDQEINEVLQLAIIGVNRLIIARGGTIGKPATKENVPRAK